jgi:hypothetical protein
MDLTPEEKQALLSYQQRKAERRRMRWLEYFSDDKMCYEHDCYKCCECLEIVDEKQE